MLEMVALPNGNTLTVVSVDVAVDAKRCNLTLTRTSKRVASDSWKAGVLHGGPLGASPSSDTCTDVSLHRSRTLAARAWRCRSGHDDLLRLMDSVVAHGFGVVKNLVHPIGIPNQPVIKVRLYPPNLHNSVSNHLLRRYLDP